MDSIWKIIFDWKQNGPYNDPLQKEGKFIQKEEK